MLALEQLFGTSWQNLCGTRTQETRIRTGWQISRQIFVAVCCSQCRICTYIYLFLRVPFDNSNQEDSHHFSGWHEVWSNNSRMNSCDFIMYIYIWYSVASPPPPPPPMVMGQASTPPPPPAVVVLWLGCGGLGWFRIGIGYI